ncbi:MAG TPA: tetratricopeptide repeat protein [Phycisphaerales bacterium]|nr:tetratricopeptide repeat protein [Phycisphaerales bacterium]
MPRFPLRASLFLPLLAFALIGCKSSGPRTIQAMRDSGDRAYVVGRYDVAESEYRQVIERAPYDKQYRKGYGLALLRNGNAPLARENLEIAHTYNPRDNEVIDGLAEAMRRSNDSEGMARFLKGLATERNGVEDWLRLGNHMHAAGDNDEARKAYLIAAKLDAGKSFDPQYLLAKFFYDIGDVSNAIERTRMAYFLRPTDDRVLTLARQLNQITGPTFGIRPAEQEPKAQSRDRSTPMN